MDKDEKTGRFLTGNNGGPGRPKGSRNKLSEDFLANLHEAWEKHGKQAIEKVAEARPDIFLKVVASVLPKEANVSHQQSMGQSMDRLLDVIEEEIEFERANRAKLVEHGPSRLI